MANFWDLHRDVRDQIYRLHLVHKDPVDRAKHSRLCREPDEPYSRKRMPPLLKVSKRTEKEAASIYYGENRFELRGMEAYWLTEWTCPRHYRLIRRVSCDWDPEEKSMSWHFESLAKLKGLVELNMRVDEGKMVDKCLESRGGPRRWNDSRDDQGYTAQEQLAIYRFPGMLGLLSLKGINAVNFVKRLDRNRHEIGGPIPGGVLLTRVLPQITAPKALKKNVASKAAATTTRSKNSRKGKAEHFDFLDLPPEIRNRIYDLLVNIDGPLHLSKMLPSSIGKKHKDDQVIPASALSLLAVNKQIRDEAAGIFYAIPLIFYYPTQLGAFLADLGSFRQGLIRDLSVQYDSTKRGSAEIIDMCFSLLRRLSGLQKLRIIMKGDLFFKIIPRHLHGGWYTTYSNPALISGMKVLFSFRGIKDIAIRDLLLEKHFSEVQEDPDYPDFEKQSRSFQIAKLTAALSHLNAALQHAQHGRVNAELFENIAWHTRDEFPTLPEEENKEEEEQPDFEVDEATAKTNELPTQRDDLKSGSDITRGEGGDQSSTVRTPAACLGLRRSARLSAKFDQAQLGEEHVAEEDSEEGEQSRDDAEDVGEDISVHRGGRAASPEL
ncbi:hypothetical protein Slin15195_G061190 [Septoria linicola]|uniref:F-box domain-containing protein n=1 Tax=Septoria linicola TaxID=215465 RepID=A0A9Q9EJ98_9PEZI|nr:hypothetical protein Slin14017_G076990 [Septoria linicola]USW52800.1 hypothetical protein Slin15195_G061190 [Septoria linicola]